MHGLDSGIIRKRGFCHRQGFAGQHNLSGMVWLAHAVAKGLETGAAPNAGSAVDYIRDSSRIGLAWMARFPGLCEAAFAPQTLSA
jgi:hypothetical protein